MDKRRAWRMAIAFPTAFWAGRSRAIASNRTIAARYRDEDYSRF
ncbi:MAG: hypothetical protein WA652_19525 [Xanthobacteraceae bacterium]